MNITGLNTTTYINPLDANNYTTLTECWNWCVTKNIESSFIPLISSCLVLLLYALTQIDLKHERLNAFIKGLFHASLLASILINIGLYIYKVV